MKNLYFVRGYDFESNEWWRFILTTTEVGEQGRDEAIKMVKEENSRLTQIAVIYLCRTENDVYMEV